MARRTRLNPCPVLAVAAALALTGCSSDSTWGLYFQAVRESLRGGFGGHRVTRGQAAAIPYASLGYSIDGGSERILVLATDTGGDQLWTSASHVVLLTRGGRVVRSVGLPHNISALTGRGSGGLPALQAALQAPYSSTRVADLPDRGAYSVAITCTTASRGRESVTILGTAIATTRVDEDCQSREPSWRFTNSYWLDPQTGQVWRSIQHLDPEGGSLEIEIFRPPG